MKPENMALSPEDLRRSVIRVFTAEKYRMKWRVFTNIFTISYLPALLAGLALAAAFAPHPVAFLFLAGSIAIIVGQEYYSPFFQGNCFLPGRSERLGFFTQMTMSPRRYSGLEGVLDDADDYGYVRVDGDWLVFEGDSCFFRIHGLDVASVVSENVGWRGAFIFGRGIRVRLHCTTEGICEMKFHTREGYTLRAARRRNRELVDYMRQSCLPWSEEK